MKLFVFEVLQTCFPILLVQLKLICGQKCPTWFQAQPGAITNSYCECGSSLGGTLECDNVTKEVSIALQYCMTYSNVSGKEKLVVGFTNTIYLKGIFRVYARLPKSVSELNDFMCSNSSRKGLLCGECVSDYGYAINSYRSQCVKCDTVYAVGMFLLCAILPMTVFFVLIVLFRLNIASGFLFGYFIFCQFYVVTFKDHTLIYTHMMNSMGSFGNVLLRLSITLAGLSQYFIGVYYLIEPICIHYNMSGLQVLFFEYIYCLYPLYLLFVTWLCIELHARNCRVMVFATKPFHYCLANVRRNWSVSDSVIHAYATFYFLSFLHLAHLSYSILRSSKLHDMNSTVIRTVLVYEPTMEWFSSQHLLYAIPAIMLLFILGILPTLLLCVQSTRLRRYFTCRSRIQLIVTTFVDTFTNCYKDGCNDTYDFRFFSSLPMIVSIFMFSLFPFVNFQLQAYTHAAVVAVLLFFAFVFAFLQPFKSVYMNFSVFFHLAILVLCTLLVMFWLESEVMSSNFLATVFTFISTLPHVVAVITIAYHCLHHIPLTRKAMKTVSGILLSVFNQSPDHEMATSSSILPDRLENSYAYRQL